MDELCYLLKSQHLTCVEENNEKLIAAYHETRDLLRKDAQENGIHQYIMKPYLETHRKRYSVQAVDNGTS
jgi:hypothetical protein